METRLAISGENDNYSLVFQGTEVVDGDVVVIVSDVRSGLSKVQLLAVLAATIHIIENN